MIWMPQQANKHEYKSEPWCYTDLPVWPVLSVFGESKI